MLRRILLLFILCFGVANFVCAEEINFIDIPDDEPLIYATNRLQSVGVVEGYGDGYLHADNGITRAETATMLWKIAGSPDLSDSYSTDEFSDVDAEHWAYTQIQFCKKHDIINGFGDDTFLPEEFVTFEQLSKMISCFVRPTSSVSYAFYPNEFIFISDESRLFEDIELNEKYNIGEVVERRDAFVMLDNALSICLQESNINFNMFSEYEALRDTYSYLKSESDDDVTLYELLFETEPKRLQISCDKAAEKFWSYYGLSSIDNRLIRTYYIEPNKNYIAAEDLNNYGFEVESIDGGLNITRKINNVPEAAAQFDPFQLVLSRQAYTPDYLSNMSPKKFDVVFAPNSVILDGEAVDSYASEAGHLIDTAHLERYVGENRPSVSGRHTFRYKTDDDYEISFSNMEEVEIRGTFTDWFSFDDSGVIDGPCIYSDSNDDLIYYYYADFDGDKNSPGRWHFPVDGYCYSLSLKADGPNGYKYLGNGGYYQNGDLINGWRCTVESHTSPVTVTITDNGVEEKFIFLNGELSPLSN